jgi:arylsulfatase A
MQRRDFLGTSLGGALALCAGSFAMAGQKVTPNIVYILVDDMGYGDVSALNPDSKIKTPNIDRLAAEGMSFTDAHSGSAVCTPTRYGILTGRYCWRSRLKDGVLWGYDQHLIEDGRETVAALLKRQGYNTACIGKWHLGMDLPTVDGDKAGPENVDWQGRIENGPVAKGFDYFFGISASLDMPPYIYIENDRFVGECTTTKAFGHPHRPGPAHADFEAVDVLPTIGRKTVEFIERQQADRPFFAYVAFTSPHTPIVPSSEFAGMSGIGEYGDFCVETDAVVGRICAALERMGFADNTLLVFTSDNGCSPEADFPHLLAQGHDPSYIYRGHKADIFDGGHRIPFIARWPGGIPAGRESAEIVCLTDLYATCADLLGVAMPMNAGEDSYSILPALRGKNLDAPIREATVHHSISGRFAIRQGRWKLNLCPGSGGWSQPRGKALEGLPPLQLYDMEKDPGETENLQSEHPETVLRLGALLEQYQRSGRSRP